MKADSLEINDFYRQLALLLAAELPLPESLRQLATQMRGQQFRAAVARLAADTAGGTPLATAMRNCPGSFQPFQIQMIESGEKSGTLPEVLKEVAEMSHMELQLAAMLKSLATYPMFVIVFSIWLMFSLYSFVVPVFLEVTGEMLPCGLVPVSFRISAWVSGVCTSYFPVLLLLLICLTGMMIWLFLSKSAAAVNLLSRCTRSLPYSGPIFTNLHMARICSIWSALIRQHMQVHKVFETLAGLTDDRQLAAGLMHVARRSADGLALAQCLYEESTITELLALTVKHTPETELPRELGMLASLYKDRAAASITNAGLLWEAILIVFMAVLTGSVIISLFAPFIEIVNRLSGN